MNCNNKNNMNTEHPVLHRQLSKYVIKRDGTIQEVQKEKIAERIQGLADNLGNTIDVRLITNNVHAQLRDKNQHTSEIDELTAEICSNMSTKHPNYNKLAGKILVSNLHKETPSTFSGAMLHLHAPHLYNRHGQLIKDVLDEKSKDTNDIKDDTKTKSTRKTRKIDIPDGFFQKRFIRAVIKHRNTLDSAIEHVRDYELDYFAVRTLIRNYLMKNSTGDTGKVVERPQYMLMRVAVTLYPTNISQAIRMYKLYASRKLIQASPTLFNAGYHNPQLSSCFLLDMKDDSIEGIYDTLKQCAMISKEAGGIGLSIHKIRARNAIIKSKRRKGTGIIPMLRNFNETARYVDQGGKRPGAFAVYIEPWHADIFDFLNLRKNHGAEHSRCRDLFLGLWIPDLFMQRVKENGKWSLFSPDEAPNLHDVYGDEFNQLYYKYEQEGLAMKTIDAQKLWLAILDAQVQTSQPYILFKDACNSKSNFKHTGIIHSSNLCTEVLLPTNKNEIGVCNLASISIKEFVNPETRTVDYDGIRQTAYWATDALNKVIDINYYPVKEAKTSNRRHRPIGIGVRGMDDARMMLRMTADSKEYLDFNSDVLEAMYFGACQRSVELAKKHGHYESFPGSPASQGILQFDMWGVKPSSDNKWDWDSLKQDVKNYGMRNSQLISLMPTASTSQITGALESFEFLTSNMYVRRTRAGEFMIVNPYLAQDLQDLNMWTPDVIENIKIHDGSIQHIEDLPQDIRELYKTVWEISNRTAIDLARARSPWVCQSQSLNLYLYSPSVDKMTSMLFYAWEQGLKTGMYYLRRGEAASAIKFTVDPTAANRYTKTITSSKSSSPHKISKRVKRQITVNDNDDDDDQSLLSHSNLPVQSCDLNGECVSCQ